MTGRAGLRSLVSPPFGDRFRVWYYGVTYLLNREDAPRPFAADRPTNGRGCEFSGQRISPLRGMMRVEALCRSFRLNS